MLNQASSLLERLIPTTLRTLACQVLLLLLVVAFTTFFISKASYTSTLSDQKDKVRKVAVLPYWLPYFGHLSLVFDRTSKLQHGRRNSPSGIFALKLFGTKYNIVWTPSLIDTAFNNDHASLNPIEPRWTLLRNLFGADECGKDEYIRLYPNDQVCLANDSKGSVLFSQFRETTLGAIEQHTPNFLSFAERPIDQNPWEQSVNPVFHDSSLVEISFFELISRFVAHVSLPTFVGTEFLENHPTTVEDLWDLDGGFQWLRWGFSRLWGIPSLTRAHIARRRLLAALLSFHEAADAVSNGDEVKHPWREISDLTSLMEERRKVWSRFQTSPGVRAACDLNLLWAMSTKPASLVFWMLLHILSNPALLTQVRAEIAYSVRIRQSPQVLSIPSPPRLSIKHIGLGIDFHLLKPCLYECLRLYTTPTPTCFVDKDTTIRDPDGKIHSHEDYILESGNYITAPLTLVHHNPRYFWQPNEFQPRRFLEARESKTRTENQTQDNKEHNIQPFQRFHQPSTLQPFGIGPSACPARDYAEAEILSFVAAILSLWEFEPADPKGWIIPDRRDGEIVSVPKWDIRVKVRAREVTYFDEEKHEEDMKRMPTFTFGAK